MSVHPTKVQGITSQKNISLLINEGQLQILLAEMQPSHHFISNFYGDFPKSRKKGTISVTATWLSKVTGRCRSKLLLLHIWLTSALGLCVRISVRFVGPCNQRYCDRPVSGLGSLNPFETNNSYRLISGQGKKRLFRQS